MKGNGVGGGEERVLELKKEFFFYYSFYHGIEKEQ
jgi:hypothetical protein